MPSNLYQEALKEVLAEPEKARKEFLAACDNTLQTIKKIVAAAKTQTPINTKMESDIKACQTLLDSYTADKLNGNSAATISSAITSLIENTREITNPPVKKTRRSSIKETAKQTMLVEEDKIKNFSEFNAIRGSLDGPERQAIFVAEAYLKKLDDALAKQDWNTYGNKDAILEKQKTISAYVVANSAYTTLSKKLVEPREIQSKQQEVAKQDNYLNLEILEAMREKEAPEKKSGLKKLFDNSPVARVLRLLKGDTTRDAKLDFPAEQPTDKNKPPVIIQQQIDDIMERVKSLQAKAEKYGGNNDYINDAQVNLYKITEIVKTTIRHALHQNYLTTGIKKSDKGGLASDSSAKRKRDQDIQSLFKEIEQTILPKAEEKLKEATRNYALLDKKVTLWENKLSYGIELLAIKLGLKGADKTRQGEILQATSQPDVALYLKLKNDLAELTNNKGLNNSQFAVDFILQKIQSLASNHSDAKRIEALQTEYMQNFTQQISAIKTVIKDNLKNPEYKGLVSLDATLADLERPFKASNKNLEASAIKCDSNINQYGKMSLEEKLRPKTDDTLKNILELDANYKKDFLKLLDRAPLELKNITASLPIELRPALPSVEATQTPASVATDKEEEQTRFEFNYEEDNDELEIEEEVAEDEDEEISLRITPEPEEPNDLDNFIDPATENSNDEDEIRSDRQAVQDGVLQTDNAYTAPNVAVESQPEPTRMRAGKA